MSAVDPRDELAQVARHTRSKVREENLLWSGTSPFDQTCRFTWEGSKVDWATNGKLFLIGVRASSAIVLAAGKRDRILSASNPIGRIGGVNVYETDGFSPRHWLDDPAHEALLARLEIKRGEQLLVARNVAHLTAKPRGFDQDWERLGRLIEFVRELPPEEVPDTRGELIDGLSFETACVPKELRVLTPMLRKWSVSDDAERSLLTEDASDKALCELWRAVGPRLVAIDKFIDAHEESDEAVLLGSLAQAAHEASLELKRRAQSTD